jgi:hypothetical protein
LRSGRDEGQLVCDQLTYRKYGENYQGYFVGEESEQPGVEMQPTQVSSPGHDSWSGHGAKAANAANQEGVEEDHHGSTMASLPGDVKPATVG